MVVSCGWFSSQLTPDQKLNPSLSWTPNSSGEYIAEIFIWEGFKDHIAIAEHTKTSTSVV